MSTKQIKSGLTFVRSEMSAVAEVKYSEGDKAQANAIWAFLRWAADELEREVKPKRKSNAIN